MALQLESSNPAIESMSKAAREWDDPVDRATLTGVAEKTALLVGVAAVAGMLGYVFLPPVFGVLLASSLAAFVVCLGVGWAIAGNPKGAWALAPVYAVVEGVFLGVFTKVLDEALRMRGIGPEVVAGSLALPAFVITIACTVSMVTLYRVGVLRPTETFTSVVKTLTLGVFFAYLAMFILSFAGIQVPFLSLGSAMAGGQQALIGLGLNAAILVLASLWLIIDLGKIERIVDGGGAKSLEWYGAFCLLVTLAWIYYEAVKLAFRVAMAMRKR
jgi:uncharacterized YccA/Bax inhibitor family protein